MKIIIMENDIYSAAGLKFLSGRCGLITEEIEIVTSIHALKDSLSHTKFDRIITRIQGCDENIGDWLGLLADFPTYFAQEKVITWEPTGSKRLTLLSGKTFITPKNIDKNGRIADILHQISLFLMPGKIPSEANTPSAKLSMKEMKILSMLCTGDTPKIISALTKMPIKTISLHKTRAIKKFGVKNLTELLFY